MSTNADEAHRRAEALFKKEQQLREGQQAMAELPDRTACDAGKNCAVAGAPLGSRRRQSEDAACQPEGRGVNRKPLRQDAKRPLARALIGRFYAASVANSRLDN
jgi:hypothetical protein